MRLKGWEGLKVLGGRNYIDWVDGMDRGGGIVQYFRVDCRLAFRRMGRYSLSQALAEFSLALVFAHRGG